MTPKGARRPAPEGSQVDTNQNEITRREKIMKKIVCRKCGSDEIQYNAWVDMNTGEAMDEGPSDDYWCPDCEDHVSHTDEVETQIPASGWENGERCHPECLGWAVFNDAEIQRCDECARFASDEEAIAHVEALERLERQLQARPKFFQLHQRVNQRRGQ